MSNFGSLAQISEGLQGTAPNVYVASTVDNLAAITASGYLNDIKAKVKLNDLFFINYSDTSAFPLNTGEASTFGAFSVSYASSNWSLVPAFAASASGSFTAGDVLQAGNAQGQVADSGILASTLPQHARVNITAAQWKAMYTTPIQLLPAPGANNLIVLDQMVLTLTYGTAQYTGGGVVRVGYGNDPQAAFVSQLISDMAAADFTGATASTAFSAAGNLLSSGSPGALLASAVDLAVYISNATAAFATGDSNFIADLYYRIVQAV